MLKIDADGFCPECAVAVRRSLSDEIAGLRRKIADMEDLLTPQMRDAQKLREYCDSLIEQRASLDDSILKSRKQWQDLKTRVAEQEAQIVANDEILELEEFAVYRPRFAFSNSEEYKRALDDTRAKEKAMIKNGTAATGSTDWRVNGDLKQGRKMVNDMKKLCIRAFNNECDAAVAGVKFNNYDRQEMRIEKSYDQIAKLGTIMSVSISPAYKALKIKELQIALEYAEMKQQEKEELRELRARQREEAKLAKEIEEARKAAYKEQTHYQIALSKIEKQLANATEAERADLEARREEIASHLDTIETNLKDIDYREANQRAGYVYVISNIGSFGEGVYKIGMTRRLEPMERIYELSDASVPFNFDLHAMIFSDDAPRLEAALHRAFDDRKVNAVNHRREFFRVPLAEIKDVIRQNHDKTVEFVDVPDAEQYRETLKLQAAANHH